MDGAMKPMRPSDLGFPEPCQRCIDYVRVGLLTGSQSVPSYLEGHGNLQSLSVDDVCSHEGYYYRYQCAVCTCRWLIYEWGWTGWLNIEQESADGGHYARGKYEEGSKHGWHEYYPRYYPAEERHAPIVLAELWDHGRLMQRKVNGALVYQAKAIRKTRRK
jgi:hypothetical protein